MQADVGQKEGLLCVLSAFAVLSRFTDKATAEIKYMADTLDLGQTAADALELYDLRGMPDQI